MQHFIEFINERSGKYFSRGEENLAKIYLQYLNPLPRYLNSIIFNFSNSAGLFCIRGQPFPTHFLQTIAWHLKNLDLLKYCSQLIWFLRFDLDENMLNDIIVSPSTDMIGEIGSGYPLMSMIVIGSCFLY